MHINFLIKHRINTIEGLKSVPEEYGIELDIRAEGDRMILHHDPFAKGEDFEEYLKHYNHKFLILNCKCEGMEQRIISLMAKHEIEDYFFLDLSIPFLIKTAKTGCKKIAVRYSKYEPMTFVEKFAGVCDWVWVDCFSKNVLDSETYRELSKHFKICIVSPELQAHPLEMISDFKEQFQSFNIEAVCTKRPDLWK